MSFSSALTAGIAVAVAVTALLIGSGIGVLVTHARIRVRLEPDPEGDPRGGPKVDPKKKHIVKNQQAKKRKTEKQKTKHEVHDDDSSQDDMHDRINSVLGAPGWLEYQRVFDQDALFAKMNCAISSVLPITCVLEGDRLKPLIELMGEDASNVDWAEMFRRSDSQRVHLVWHSVVYRILTMRMDWRADSATSLLPPGFSAIWRLRREYELKKGPRRGGKMQEHLINHIPRMLTHYAVCAYDLQNAEVDEAGTDPVRIPPSDPRYPAAKAAEEAIWKAIGPVVSDESHMIFGRGESAVRADIAWAVSFAAHMALMNFVRDEVREITWEGYDAPEKCEGLKVDFPVVPGIHRRYWTSKSTTFSSPV